MAREAQQWQRVNTAARTMQAPYVEAATLAPLDTPYAAYCFVFYFVQNVGT